MTDEEAAECVREARMTAAFEHPNVVRTYSIAARSDEISVRSEYVAGERLSELWSSTSGREASPPLGIALRILVDVSTGLGALHKLRGEDGQERVKFIHGEVTSSNVLVGVDGVSLILRAARVRRRNVHPKALIGTLAPEILLGESADQRADIYSLGALLWQALSGRPLFAKDDIDEILASAKQGQVARAIVANDASWALPLADIAARALASVPEKRFPTASSMLTELRRIAGPKLATPEEVAKFVEEVAGERISARLSDVQASAVIRKATSIPAPRSAAPAQKLALAEVKLPVVRDEAPSITADVEPTLPITPIRMAIEPPRSAPPIAPPIIAPPRSAPPRLPPPKSAPKVQVAVATPISPKIETAPSGALPQPSSPPSRPSSKPRTADRPRPAPAPSAKPISRPSGQKAAKASPAASALVTSPVASRSLPWVIGTLLAIALVTGWFALQAIRNRQAIETPGSTSVEISKIPAPASSQPSGEPAAGVVSPVKSHAAPKATTSATARPTKGSAPPKAPSSEHRP